MTNPSVNRAVSPVYEHGDWVQVYIDHIEGEDGPGRIRIEEKNGRNGVAILPLTPGKIGLVELFRPLLGTVSMEIPRGFGETMDPRADAVRELSEESGIEVDPSELISLGKVQPNNGILASETLLFAVILEKETGGRIKDRKEVRRFHWMPIVETLDAIGRDEVRDGFTHAAILRALLLGLIKIPAHQPTSSK